MFRSFHVSFLLSSLTVSLLLGQCGSKGIPVPHPEPDTVLMHLGDEFLTVRDFLVAFQESYAFESILAAEAQKNLQDTLKDIGITIAFERFLAEKAIKAGLNQSEAFLAAHENSLKDELSQKVILHNVMRKIHVTEKEVRHFYETNKAILFVTPNTNEIVIRPLYVSYQNRPISEARAKADQAYKELQEGHPFRVVAQKYSDAEPYKRGRENHFRLEDLPPDISDQLVPLKDSEITPVFEVPSQKRFYILKKIRFIEPTYIAYEDIRESILKTMTEERLQNGIFLLTQEYQKKYDLLINPDGLSDTQSGATDSIVLSVPGVYELSLGEFKELARQQKKWTFQDQKDYLFYLGNKAVCLAEAYERQWTEKDVALAIQYWDRHTLSQLYIQNESAQQIHITDEEIRTLYEKNQTHPKLQTPVYYDLSRLFFSIPITSSLSYQQIQILFAQAKEMAKRALQDIQAGMSMEDIVAKYQQNPNIVVSHGRWNDITLHDLSPQDQSFLVPQDGTAMKAGDIKGPLKIENLTKKRYGYEIYYVRDTIPSRPMTYEEARQAIQQWVSNDAALKVRKRFYESFVQEHPLKIEETEMQALANYLTTLAHRPDWQTDITRYEEPQN